MKGELLDDEHHVIRHCAGKAVEKEEGIPVGITRAAFDDDDTDGVSVTWIEYFASADDPEAAAAAVIRATRTVRKSNALAKLNVGLVRRAGDLFGVDLDVEHDPLPENPAHSLIKGLTPNQHFELMEQLALDTIALVM